MIEDLSKLGEDYKTILIASLLSEDLNVTAEGLVDLSHYNKPFKAPGFVKKAIHGTILDVNEAVHNFLEEVKGNPNLRVLPNE